ncbi:metallophosphoesterase [Mycoplasmatota bacterium WC44]
MRRLMNLAVLIFIIATIFQNNSIVVKKYDILESDIRIVQLSDLHTKSFGENNSLLIDKVKRLNPDVITITGDLIDGSNIDFIYIANTVKQLNDIAPVLFILGNNDMWSNEVEMIIEVVELSGGLFLNNESINIKGVNFFGHNPYYNYSNVKNSMKKLSNLNKELVLLTHQPEKIDNFSDYYFDLVLSGHTHGGQIRVPLIGAIIAPDQGTFPKYDKGLYELENCTLIVSSGLGNSIIPIRIFNAPEIILIT